MARVLLMDEEIILACSCVDVTEEPMNISVNTPIFWRRVVKRYNREAIRARSKDQLFLKWRNANVVAMKLHTIFFKVMLEAVNGENENILFVNALDVFCEKKLTNLSGLLNFSNVKECDK